MSAPANNDVCPIVSEDAATQQWFFWRWLEARQAAGAGSSAPAAGAPEPEEEVDAPPPLPEPAAAPVGLAAGLAAGAAAPDEPTHLKNRITGFLEIPKFSRWAAVACSLLEELLGQEEALRADADLLNLAHRLINAAFGDCDFAHCYLSVAEEVEWMLKSL
jgi:hypothetical protein